MTDTSNSHRVVGYLMLLGALVMTVLAALFRTEIIADPGPSRDTVSLILFGVAAVDAVIGIVLIVRS